MELNLKDTGMPGIKCHHYKEKIMKHYKWLSMMLVVSLNIWGCADTTPKKELDVKKAHMVSVSAIVQKIDLNKRVVTIRGPEGNIRKIHVSKEVVNLPQVRVGDKVKLEYYQSVAVRMAKPGEVRDEVSERAGRAKPGEKPGYAEATETTVTAKILDLDKMNMTATLKMPDGDAEVVDVEDPANMDKVKVGDTIVITYTEALAISVREVK